MLSVAVIIASATMTLLTPLGARAAADPPGTAVLPASYWWHDLTAGRFTAVGANGQGILEYPVSVVGGAVEVGSPRTITQIVFDGVTADGRRTAWGDPVTGDLTVDASGVQTAYPQEAIFPWQMTGHRVLFEGPLATRVLDIPSGVTVNAGQLAYALNHRGYARTTPAGAVEFFGFQGGGVTPVATAAEVEWAGYQFQVLGAIGDRIFWHSVDNTLGTGVLRWRDLNVPTLHEVSPAPELWAIHGKFAVVGTSVVNVETNTPVWNAPPNSTVEDVNGSVVLWRDETAGTPVWKLSPLSLGLAPRHEGNPIAPSDFAFGSSWTAEWVFEEALTSCVVEFRRAINGTLVRSLPCEPAAMKLGEAMITWDGKDESGAAVALGGYVATVVAGDADGPVTDPSGAAGPITQYVVAPASPCGGAAATTRQLNLDVTCDGYADMVTVDTSGQLVFYPGLAGGTFGFPQVIGSGWNGFTAIITPGAQRAGSYPAVWARTPDGRLLSYALSADTAGVVTIRYDRLIGTGWGGISAMTPAGDVNGDGDGDLYGRALNGNLNLYFGNGSGIASQMLVGTGWNGLDAIFGGFDITGEGLNDVVGRDRTTGALRRYPASASGALTGSGPVIGTGWGGLNPLASLSSPLGGNRMVGMLPDGRLQAYPMSNTGSITGPVTIATGWTSNRLMW